MKTQCPNCKARFNVDDKFAGKQAKCPKCTKPFIIQPVIESPAAVPPAVTQSPKPADAPAKVAAPAAPLEKVPEPVKPPVTAPRPVETPVAKTAEPAAPPAKGPEPAAPHIEVPKPVESPAKIETTAAPPERIPEPIAPPVKLPEPAASTVKRTEPVKTAIKIPEPVKEETPELKPASKKAISKGLFVFVWAVVRIIAGAAAAAGLVLALRKEAQTTLMATFAGADVFLVLSILIELMLFYKMWAAIKDNQASITPGKAVGFLFIPVFNLYWALCMVIGFAEDYNSFIQRRSLKIKSLPMAPYLIYAFALMMSILFITTPMLCVFGFLRYINPAFTGYASAAWTLLIFAAAVGTIHFITYMLFAIKTCNAINALPVKK